MNYELEIDVDNSAVFDLNARGMWSIQIEYSVVINSGGEVELDEWNGYLFNDGDLVQDDFDGNTKSGYEYLVKCINQHIDENISKILDKEGYESPRNEYEYSRNYINALNRGE